MCSGGKSQQGASNSRKIALLPASQTVSLQFDLHSVKLLCNSSCTKWKKRSLMANQQEPTDFWDWIEILSSYSSINADFALKAASGSNFR